MKVRDAIEQAFIAGYRHSLQTWAFWKDGRQYVGNATHLPLEDAMREAGEALEYPIDNFIEKLGKTFGVAQEAPLPPAVGGTSDGAS